MSTATISEASELEPEKPAADPAIHPPDLRVAVFWCGLFLTVCTLLPHVRPFGLAMSPWVMPGFLGALGHPVLRALSAAYFVISALGLVTAVVGRLASVRTRMWLCLIAGLSPFVGLIVTICMGIGLMNLWRMMFYGSWLSLVAGTLLLILAYIEHSCLELPRVSVRSWLQVTGPQFKVGTLSYTRRGLMAMFCWLLWGDVVWRLMEKVHEVSMPFQVRRLGISDKWINLLAKTMASIVALAMVPIVSFASDRTRTRYGRRIPYILATIIPLVFFLCLLGYTDALNSIGQTRWPRLLHMSVENTKILVLGTMLVLFGFFNVFVNTVFWYLFRDVIPAAFMGRFMSAFIIVNAVADLIWNQVFFAKIETHTSELYLTTGLAYLFGFSLMCLMVKEGEYPPPQPIERSDPWYKRQWTAVKIYASECFSHPLFVMYYVAGAMLYFSQQCALYRTLFLNKEMGFSLSTLANLNSFLVIFALLLPIPLGKLVDKFHPMRMYVIAMTGSIPIYLCQYLLGVNHAAGIAMNFLGMWIGLSMLQSPLQHLDSVSSIPLNMRLFPQKQYGQFASANAMVRTFAVIFGSAIAGFYMGHMKDKYGINGGHYLFLWQFIFHTLSVVCLWIVFIMWRRYGGDNFKFDPETPSAGTYTG